MNQRERLAICSLCINRQLDFESGYVCQLTGKAADFKETCKYYRRDETVINTDKVPKYQPPVEQHLTPSPVRAEAETKKKTVERKKPAGKEKATEYKKTTEKKKTADKQEPSKIGRKKLLRYQSFILALIGGLLFAAVFSAGWVYVARTTGYEGVYMAPVLGLLVGITVRFFGAGINRIFGILAVLLALAGSLTGHYLSQTDFLKELQLASILNVPDYLNPDLLISTIKETFQPLDLLFYGLAALLGYLLAIRRISKRKMARLEQDDNRGAPVLHWLRLPLILVCILLPAYYGYSLTHREPGVDKILYYESGTIMSRGEMHKGMETGLWTSWYENGNMKSTGYYVDGKKDSLWLWYDESGILTRSDTYRDDVENGTTINYYPGGIISDSGAYRDGLKEGTWRYYFENGDLKFAINYKAGNMIEEE